MTKNLKPPTPSSRTLWILFFAGIAALIGIRWTTGAEPSTEVQATVWAIRALLVGVGIIGIRNLNRSSAIWDAGREWERRNG
jgi:hypothetical protein